jgi:hypothetical protein
MSEHFGWVVIRKTDEGDYEALVEHSFSMGKSKTNARYFWSGQAWDNLGLIDSEGPGSTIDGLRDATHNRDKAFPNQGFVVVEVNDPACPIILDWDAYELAGQPDPKKLSGIRDKFTRRNVPFRLKV